MPHTKKGKSHIKISSSLTLMLKFRLRSIEVAHGAMKRTSLNKWLAGYKVCELLLATDDEVSPWLW